MIEIKLSQGAKPGHGGVLPAAKVSRRDRRASAACRKASIASRRRVIPPFDTPIELVAVRRRAAPAVGRQADRLQAVHRPPLGVPRHRQGDAARPGITPDFIVIDGKEGGTGAAPLEFMDHIGMPLRDGLSFAHNALVGAGLRERIKLGASGKIVTAFDIARAMALGADWCNSARGFMFALGCIQAQSCHTDKCPTGVATQDPLRQRALVVPDKAVRVAQFHKATLKALAELIAAAGLSHPSELRPYHIFQRDTVTGAASYAELYPALREGELLDGTEDKRFAEAWRLARADTFQRAG